MTIIHEDGYRLLNLTLNGLRYGISKTVDDYRITANIAA